MILRTLALSILLASSLASGALAADTKPVRVILVGDSTMAANSGYGSALCKRFAPEVSCHNLARAGRSSSSFRAEGLWGEVEKLLRDNQGFSATYVVVGFGHNDQPGKGDRSTDLVTQFPANMARYVNDVRQLGGQPVLLTPLTRRTFKGPYVKDDLGPWAGAIRRVAAAQHTPLLDLNADSVAAVQAMGQAEADTFAMAPLPPGIVIEPSAAKVEVPGAPPSKFDRTHLGAKGADYFAQMVARELAAAVPALSSYLKP